MHIDSRLPGQPGVREREVRAQVQQEQPVPQLPRVQGRHLCPGELTFDQASFNCNFLAKFTRKLVESVTQGKMGVFEAIK